jgi:CBS domain-containing protein
MKPITHLLAEKGGGFWSVSPEATVYQALELMAVRNVGAVLVMEGERLAGIFSERDYARKVALEGRSSKDTLVRDIMTTKVVCVTPTQSVEDCMALMTDKRIRHLPVIDGETVLGIISVGDVVKAVISEQTFTISQLEHYITGTV